MSLCLIYLRFSVLNIKRNAEIKSYKLKISVLYWREWILIWMIFIVLIIHCVYNMYQFHKELRFLVIHIFDILSHGHKYFLKIRGNLNCQTQFSCLFSISQSVCRDILNWNAIMHIWYHFIERSNNTSALFRHFKGPMHCFYVKWLPPEYDIYS
jgi:hypothetical protein